MKRVLAMDGGGIRGILTAMLLQAIEKSCGKPLSQLFDLVSGTSTGGIIACGIAAGIPVEKLLSLYVDHGTEVFDERSFGSILEPKYNAGKLERLLRDTIGPLMLSNIVSPELLVPSYCVQLPAPADMDGDGITELACSWIFRSWKARENSQPDFPLWQVARATSAAPTYFPTAQLDGGYWMIDGGVFANNPSMCAVVSAWQNWPGEELKVLSIGTGSKVEVISGPRSQNWGLAQWAPEIASVFMDGAADTVSYECDQLLGSDFLRCEIALNGVSDAFDDASAENIKALQSLGGKFITDQLARMIAFMEE